MLSGEGRWMLSGGVGGDIKCKRAMDGDECGGMGLRGCRNVLRLVPWSRMKCCARSSTKAGVTMDGW